VRGLFGAGASGEDRKQLRLKAPKDYSYLNRSGVFAIDGVDDRQDFAKVLESFDNLGITKTEVTSICRILAALLHLGNIRFTTDGVTDGCEIESDHGTDQRSFRAWAAASAPPRRPCPG
jgi:myosin-5